MVSCSNFQSNPSSLARLYGALSLRHGTTPLPSRLRWWKVGSWLTQYAIGSFTQPILKSPEYALIWDGSFPSFPSLFPHSAIAREQSIVKVSVYTLQFMFIKIKWETREGRRWEKGEDGRGDTYRTQDKRTRREECQEFVYQTCPVREGRTNCVGENEQITLQGCSKGLLISNYSCCAFLKR